jgi:toxin ParE1/3/4
MVEITWSKRSIKDIDEIADFIAIDSLQYAREYVELFFEKVKVLAHYPLIGRPVPEWGLSSIR